MSELSIFIDESGDIGCGSKYYLLSLVFHDQSVDIKTWLDSYNQACAESSLPEIAFHFTPIMRGHAPFDTIDYATRKSMLGRFRFFVEKLPFLYTCFIYEKAEFLDASSLQARMQLDITRFIKDHLDYFQHFEYVKIYYDNGQSIVSKAVQGAVSSALFEGTIVHRNIKPSGYRLFQVADYVCGIELAAIRYSNHENGSSEERFLGSPRDFKRNYLKKLRRKRL